MGGKYLNLPITLSTLEIIILSFIFLIYWGMGDGNISLIFSLLIIILFSYSIMVHGLKRDTKNRIFIFPKIGMISLLIGIFGYVLSDALNQHFIGYIIKLVAFALGITALFGLGYTIGTIIDFFRWK